MDKRLHIRAIGDTAPDAAVEETLAPAPLPEAYPPEPETTEVAWDFEEPRQRRPILPVLLPVMALLVVLGWTGFFVWAHREAMLLAPAPPGQWIEWIGSWSLPVLLVIAVWLLAVRNSAREAARFGDIAQGLARESAALEARLMSVNRELSLAREFLTTQARELDFLGRSAGERISEHAAGLQALIADNGRQVDAIAGVSVAALENMTRLRDDLPVVANAARDVSNQIGGAGRLAQNHVSALVSGFERLNEFGEASERQVAVLRGKVEDALGALTRQAEAMETLAEARFAALRGESETFRSELDARETEALASIAARAEALRAELADAQARSDAAHTDAADALTARLDALRDEAVRIGASVREGEEQALAAWTMQVGAMQDRLVTALEEVAALDSEALGHAHARLRALTEEAEAVDARLTERNAAFDTGLTERRSRLEADESAAVASLEQRLGALDSAIARRREEQTAHLSALTAEGEALATRIAALGDTFGHVSAQGREAQAQLGDGISALASQLADTRAALDGTDTAVAGLTNASVRLLELIQASAKQSRSDLPESLTEAENRLMQIDARVADIRSVLGETVAAGDRLGDAVTTITDRGGEAMATIEAFHGRLVALTQSEEGAIAALGEQLDGFRATSSDAAQTLRGDLEQAVAALETQAQRAVTALEAQHRAIALDHAESVAAESATALRTTFLAETDAAMSQLQDAARTSAEAGREAAIQLRDQLVKVGELTANLEARVASARERAEENVDTDFARRAALITESLNSSAIDIAKALSTEVTDIAWASYLKGDRGVFTRRAVRLLDATDARAIADLYGSDYELREHINRYIHDFEAMLRTVLSTRDGHAMSVTLLSGDMGKLYVSLAQALERLRQ